MHTNLRIKYFFLSTILAIFLIIFDQWSKYIIRTSGGFYICNQNIAFGIKLPDSLFYLLWILIIAFAIFYFGNYKSKISNHKKITIPKSKIENGLSGKFVILNLFGIWNLEFGIYAQLFALNLAISGAISNLIDRLRYGCVIDFIDLKFWPIFNLADIYITIGAIILITRHTTRNKK